MSIAPHTPIPWPMGIQPSNRVGNANKDATLFNCFQEKMPDGSIHIVKRPCFEYAGSGVIGTAKGAHGNYYVVDNVVYMLTTGGVVGTMSAYTYTCNCTFADMDYSGGYVFLNNGATFYIISGTSMAAESGPGVAGPYVPGVVYLNGTVYVMTISGQIYGSNVGDPATWDVLNVISTNVTASFGIALAKQKVYIIAFSRYAITVFYNAGNPSGSPLSLLPGGQSGIGCYDANTIQTIGDDIYWVGSPETTSLSVYKMTDLKVSKVSTPAIDRLLANAGFNIGPTNPGIPFPARSFQIANAGHRFYVLNLYTISVSLVYDINQGTWMLWQSAGSAALPYFTPLDYGSNIDTSNQVVGAAAPLLNRFQNVNGAIYWANNNANADLDGVPLVLFRTENFDGGDRVKKYFKRFDFLTDQVPGSTMSVRYSEDDYQTWSNYRTVDLSVKFPHLDNLGTFRRRAYEFTHRVATPFRLRGAIAHLIAGSI